MCAQEQTKSRKKRGAIMDIRRVLARHFIRGRVHDAKGQLCSPARRGRGKLVHPSLTSHLHHLFCLDVFIVLGGGCVCVCVKSRILPALSQACPSFFFLFFCIANPSIEKHAMCAKISWCPCFILRSALCRPYQVIFWACRAFAFIHFIFFNKLGLLAMGDKGIVPFFFSAPWCGEKVIRNGDLPWLGDSARRV
ncbi:hypothetical protein BC940DRAFT_298728 [Gongronella butleri]|nr:hypothetical protein BC940DRAFT_298728 [Gongronella butleri]